MTDQLSNEELVALVERVFRPRPGERGLAVLVDLPDLAAPDSAAWKARRAMAASWASGLEEHREALGISEVLLVAFRNVGRNNAELPAEVCFLPVGGAVPDDPAELPAAAMAPLESVYERCSLAVALTEMSATAPLKLVGRRTGLRAVTMPGFVPEMVPALRLDWSAIDRRVRFLKTLLDDATGARIRFLADGEAHGLFLDLRHRLAHASGGLQTEPGSVGNLPSGETYIVPYEGEGEPSRSTGVLPVQLGDEVVLYRVENNVAVGVLSSGPRSDAEREALAREPAYANLAELGLGILAELGIEPCGELLLDEKLGLHIAFGRSDHFGGQVGPASFSDPAAVVHIDRVYIPQTQPRVQVPSVVLERASGGDLELMRDGKYVVAFD